ncbi:hypothetical protein FB45DRAFT_1117263 [Roridomyces roridus]|uniref:MIF4G domain-containing protein n=1 Tax=Roridomyces roridus TaxID=1738132 RepID=A0AAD7FCY8_9AGAR|nr:hypothetical protein FB45DRAFT_1117263 [Roridomyces roridus]
MPPPSLTSDYEADSRARARSLLNKLASSNFDSIASKLQGIFDDRPGLLYRQRHEGEVKVLVEAAAWDSTRSGLYARLCQRIVLDCRDRSTSGDEKNSNWRNRSLSKSAGQLFQEMLLEQLNPVSSAYLDLLRKLFKIELLPEKKMHEMIETFLGDARTPSAADAQFFCALLKAAGPYLEKEHASVKMAVYASRIREYSKSRTLPGHLRIMFQELMDLRARKWAVPERDESTTPPVDFEADTYISLTERSILLGLLDPILRERDLEAAHRLLPSLCQHYISTVIELTVRKVLVSADESLTQFVRELLRTGVCYDLFITSAVQAGFRLVVGDAHWKSEDVKTIVSLLEAAGLNGEIIAGDDPAAGESQSGNSSPRPAAPNLLGTPQILDAICATLSISLPVIRPSGDVERGEFERWLASFLEHIQSMYENPESESLRSEVNQLSQQLAQNIKQGEESAHGRDLAEKMCNSEQIRRIEAESRLRKTEGDLEKAEARLKSLEERLVAAEQRSRMMEAQLRTGEGAMKKRAREEGRDEMLVEITQLLSSKRQEERRAREAEKERVEREANDARKREEEIKRRAERARGAERERVRCQKRDAELTDKYRFWTAAVAFERFQRILVEEEFNKIKFSDSVPLIFEALPWPTIALPGGYHAADITAQSVRNFFASHAVISAVSAAYPLSRDYRKYIIKQGLLAFHEDKMFARLATVGEDELRQEIADAAKIVTQTLNDLMSETG